ncbi:MAG TPA: thiol reductant ABC exporter subunit CydD [Ktedonobacterales bacterium]
MDTFSTRYLPSIRGRLMLVVAVALLGTLAIIAQMALLSTIVSQVFLSNAGLATLWTTLLLLLIAGAARAMLTGAEELMAKRMAISCKSTLCTRLFAQLLRLGPTYSRDERTGELVTTAVEGIERLDAYISRYLPQVFLSVLVPLGIAAAIGFQDVATAVLLVVTAPIIPLLMVIIGRYAEERVQRQWEGLTRMGAHFLDVVQGLPTLLLFGRAEAESSRIARISERFRERTMHVLRAAFLSGMVLEFMVTCAIGVIAVTLGVRLINGDIPFERAFFVLLLTPEFYRPLRDLGTHRHAGMEGKAAMMRIAQVLDGPLPASTRTSPTQSEIPSAPKGLLTLELRDVSYTYPGSDRRTLDSVCLTLDAGTCTALVGRSGAGKSTLANVLLRFLDAQGGMVTANDLPIDTLPPEIWRNEVALVPQHPYLFAGTVRENLRLARPEASDADITRAAGLAGADEFIRELAQGYETPIGERGARLSAGQAQRIAIARAFLKDAQLLILDEPTSHLDPESEAVIRHAVQALMRGRTVLVIAHRLNTIMAAEQIAVMEHGHIVEAGTHADLLQADGAYARLAGRARTSMARESTEVTTEGAAQQVNVMV